MSLPSRLVEGVETLRIDSSVSSAFFRNGQVIETFRGRGIRQPAVDLAIEKVNDGGWVRIVRLGSGNCTF